MVISDSGILNVKQNHVRLEQITNLMFELAYKMRKTASHNKKQSIKLNADILK